MAANRGHCTEPRCMPIYRILIALTVACCTITSIKAASKPVTVTLDSKWSWTPLVLETSEYLAKESSEKFWKFVELSRDLYTKTTDLDQYNTILENAGKIVSPLGLKMLQFSLSMRYYSPKVELFNKVSHEVPSGMQCSAFVEIGDKVTCDVKEASTLVDSTDQVAAQEKYPFDHHYPESRDNNVTVVLHGLMGTVKFTAFHDMLVTKATEGKVHYVLRHYYIQNPSQKNVRLSGYGVELAVKRTEYKAVDDTKVKEDASHSKMTKAEEDEDEVEGFLFTKLRKLHPDLKEQLEQFKTHLKESSKEMAPLKVWQLQDLSFQAAQRVVSSDPKSALKVLRDISQNVPKLARSLVKTRVKDDLRREVIENQKLLSKLGLEAGDGALFLNGRMVDIDDLNPFELLDILREESTALEQLASLGVAGEPLSTLSVMSVSSDKDSFILDTRDDSVVFINDMENDRQYAGWPSQVQELLRPTFPGMLRYLARNIFHIVMFVNPVDPAGIELIRTADEFIRASMPARIGLVLVADAEPLTDARKQNAGVAIARAFHFVKSEKDHRQALDWLIQLYNRASSFTDEALTKAVWDKLVSGFGTDDANEILGPDSENDEGRKEWKRFFDRTGFHNTPQVVVNGVPIKSEEISILEEVVIRQMLMQTGPIQQDVFMGHINQYTDVYTHVMSKPNVVKRLNSIIQAPERTVIDLTGGSVGADVTLDDVTRFRELEHAQMVAVVERSMKYFTRMGEEMSLKPLTSWLVVDLTSIEGRKLLRAALSQMKSSANVRVGILHNPASEPTSKLYLAKAVEAVLGSRDHVTPAMLVFMEKLLDEKNDFAALNDDVEAMLAFLNEHKNLKMKVIEKTLRDGTTLNGRIASHQKFCSSLLKQGQNGVIANGRVLGSLNKDEIFIKEDFQLLEDFDQDLYARKVRNQVDKMVFSGLSADDDTSEYRSNIIMKVSSVLLARESTTRIDLPIKNAEHSVVKVPSESDASMSVTVIIDPLSKAAQKITPVLMVLQNVTNVNINVYMNCREKLSEFPLNRFYRYVLEPQITFDSTGKMQVPFGVFSDLPQSPILTMGMDTPLGWMVEAVRSPHDLDNIHLAEVSKGVTANFELEYIFIEGHCSDQMSGQPPRGLQFTLGTKAKPDTFDTIVMANLGYFQLKAFPGSWLLRVRDGRSAEIYDIASVKGGTKVGDSSNFTVFIDSFVGKLLKVRVKRKPGMEQADLLSDGEKEEGYGGLWDSISSMVGSEKKETTGEKDKVINIFSLASGHLYERFMRIMMLSVLKHTKSKVKFWFLKNFLSPTFKAFLPHMAKEYGCEYELVQYQWPRWLHAQTEKQRVIWGYKILFLDVLFPLNVKRILFVDADLIVRTDLQELMDMDLEGAPYAYTPFCSSRTEMDGFRFWNQGYWRSHMGGRPYHISALYAIDLKRFRRLAAGDRLRGQYQGLSQDPNSLANLDQDLPNNMIHQVPIKSLPQNWLWCETWCDDASLKTAKTIDLCNNPQTKEPKLNSAVRIVKEWPEYDEEVRRLQERVAASGKSTEHAQSTKPSTPETAQQDKQEL